MADQQRKLKLRKSGSEAADFLFDRYQSQLFSVRSDADFNALALEIFRYQATNNPTYREFLSGIAVQPEAIARWQQIPALPIEFFKQHQVQTGQFEPEIVFESSGTTGATTSQHLVGSLALYEKSFSEAFQAFYGKPQDFCVLALLPAYLERQGSSLVYMADHLIKQSGHSKSGFYLHDLEELSQTLRELEAQDQPTVLLGVTFALLDLAEQYPMNLKRTIVMETGGMKGRRTEMLREEVHQVLKSGLGVQKIHSEYGMTELLSQAYSAGNGLFSCPPWMRISIRDTTDPLSLVPTGRSGGINVIDLANIHSCAFLATQDLGRITESNQFEVLGRFDHSDIRGL